MESSIIFRPLQTSDFLQFATWLAKPHVQTWWREPATVEHVSKDYGDCTRGDMTTRVFVVMYDDKPIGIFQSFYLASYPEEEAYYPIRGAISIDYLIGEEDYIGKGIGTRMIKTFIKEMVPQLYPDATGVATGAEVENKASLGALRNAGFEPGEIITGEYGTPEQLMVLQLTD